MPETLLPELFVIFMQAGPMMAGAMGDVPLTAQELTAWAQGTGCILTPWEFETILTLSRDYYAAYQAARKPTCPAPWINYTDGNDKARVSKDIKALLRSR
jgi:hypothetical protein